MTPRIRLIPAGAGSGKTHTIQSTVTQWIREGVVAPERILAVTFTEAAADELRTRIRSGLLAAGLVDAALAMEQAYLSTIHGLGRRLLIEHALGAGLAPGARVLDAVEASRLLQQTLTGISALDPIREDPERFGYRSRGAQAPDPEEQVLNQVLRTVDTLRALGDTGSNPDLATAAVERIRTLYGAVEADPTPLEHQLRTAVRALLTRFPDVLATAADGPSVREAFSRDWQALKRALEPGELERNPSLWVALTTLRQSKRGRPTPDGYDALAEAVRTAAAGINVHPGPLDDACIHCRLLIEGAQALMADYARRKRAAGVVDYADMVCEAERLLRTRPEVSNALLGEIDCVIVDEFQDTSPIQFALLWQIARRADRVLLVGDTRQSIMGFQGADPRLSDALEQQLRQSDPAAVTPLTRNWRSDPHLMTLINAISSGLFGGRYQPLSPMRAETGQACATVLTLPDGRSTTRIRPEVRVAAHIRQLLTQPVIVVDPDSHPDQPLHRPATAADIAVLCPRHSMADRYAAALREMGIPVRKRASGWLDSPAVLVTRHAMAWAADPGDRHAALTVLTLGPPGIPLDEALQWLVDGRLEQHPALAGLRALFPDAAALPLETLLARVRVTAGIPDWAAGLPDPQQAHADLMRLEAEVRAFASAHPDHKAAVGFHGDSVQAFLGWLEHRRTQRDADQRPDPGQGMAAGVDIVTWHAAKGREWPITLVVGLDDSIEEKPGSLHTGFTDFSNPDTILSSATLLWTPDLAIPEKRARFTAAREEAVLANARRLLYVVLTRARDRLILEWPAFQFTGKSKRSTRSHADLLLETGFQPTETGVLVGDQLFTVPVIVPDSHEPGPGLEPQAEEQRPGFGRRQTGSAGPRTPWRTRPSAKPGSPGKPVTPCETKTIPLGTPMQHTTLDRTAADRGTALHRAIRVLLSRPDLRQHLPEATGLDPATLLALETQTNALHDWLTRTGYPRIACELPIEARHPDGSGFNGVIDLLATGPAGQLILDHKSGSGCFTDHLPQLLAYRNPLQAQTGPIPTSLAIHWIDRATIEIAVETTHNLT